MAARNTAFQKLKPPCVALCQAALALNGPAGDIRTVTTCLETLQRTLHSIVSKRDALDAKLAEYAFFPISQVLKVSKKVSIRILELCLQCCATLVRKGWQSDVPAQLAGQLVIFASLLANKQPAGLAFAESTSELQASAFQCLTAIFEVVGPGSEVSDLFTNQTKFPQQGQAISVILSELEESDSTEVQMVATSALEALISNVLDHSMQVSYLPGMSSKLVRVLIVQTRSRRPYQVLVGCLRVMETLLRDTMGSTKMTANTRTIENGSIAAEASPVDNDWQSEAAIQLKPGLESIMKLRNHARSDVQHALGTLCLTILQTCRHTLATCSQSALATLVTLCATNIDSALDTEFQMVVSSSAQTSTQLQTILYDSLESLPLVMQGSDEQKKLTRLQQITNSYRVLRKAGIDRSELVRVLAARMRDSLVVMLLENEVQSGNVQPYHSAQSMSLVLAESSGSAHFTCALVPKSQMPILAAIEDTVRLATIGDSAASLITELSRDLRSSNGAIQLSTLRLLTIAISNGLAIRDDRINDMLVDEPSGHSGLAEDLEELYSFCLSVLTESSSQPTDPRLHALALQGLALRARYSGKQFRYELVDALYPVLHALASPHEDLQRDSIAALNIFVSSCCYTSVKDLIVENVDYLTNAVALRLNTFDISPQAPQVLLMMVRLAGPSLLPYLEDTVDSIFAILETYHGYPLLVELMFKVLTVIADEGTKAPQLAITSGYAEQLNAVMVDRWKPASMGDVLSLLRDDAATKRSEAANDEEAIRETHPQQPWGDLKENGHNDGHLEANANGDDQMVDAENLPPAPKTYSILFRITELAQHHLPSASPSLRGSLLSLIHTTTSSIARHEDSFLPLINTLWPEVVARLDDEEAHIIAAALGVICVFCQNARDFMRTRIVEVWPRLSEIHTSLKKPSGGSMQHVSRDAKLMQQPDVTASIMNVSARSNGTSAQDARWNEGDTSTALLQNSLVECVVAIVRFVQVSPKLLDQALEILEPAIDQDVVQYAFSDEAPDALWLLQMRSGRIPKPDPPIVPLNSGWHFASVHMHNAI